MNKVIWFEQTPEELQCPAGPVLLVRFEGLTSMKNRSPRCLSIQMSMTADVSLADTQYLTVCKSICNEYLTVSNTSLMKSAYELF